MHAYQIPPTNVPIALLVSTDPLLEKEISVQCAGSSFQLQRIELKKNSELQSKYNYGVVFIDLRQCAESPPLSRLSQLPNDRPIARIGLFNNYQELQARSEMLDQLDQYLLLDKMQPGEFAFNVAQSIKRAQRNFKIIWDQCLLDTLLNNIPDYVYIKDLRSRLIRVNKFYCEKFGFSADEILGKTDFDLFKTEHAVPAFKDEQSIIHKNQSIIRRLENETFPDGKTNWVSTIKVPLKDNLGNIIGTMGISRDVGDLQPASA